MKSLHLCSIYNSVSPVICLVGEVGNSHVWTILCWLLLQPSQCELLVILPGKVSYFHFLVYHRSVNYATIEIFICQKPELVSLVIYIMFDVWCLIGDVLSKFTTVWLLLSLIYIVNYIMFGDVHFYIYFLLISRYQGVEFVNIKWSICAIVWFILSKFLSYNLGFIIFLGIIFHMVGLCCHDGRSWVYVVKAFLIRNNQLIL